MCHTQQLDLFNNQIGDTGVTALAEACARGALAKCTRLKIWGNQIGDAGCTALADACARGALPQCTVLRLSRNQIGDAGITALAQAIKPVSEGRSEALPSLEKLYLDDGPRGTEHPALKAACMARGITFH